MDQLLFRSAHLLYPSTNLHLLGCPCPMSIKVTWFLTVNINTSSAMHVLWWSIPWWNQSGLNLSTSRKDNQKFGNETYRLPWYTYVKKCQNLMSTLSLKSCNQNHIPSKLAIRPYLLLEVQWLNHQLEDKEKLLSKEQESVSLVCTSV
jgi:hypothetical protein